MIPQKVTYLRTSFSEYSDLATISSSILVSAWNSSLSTPESNTIIFLVQIAVAVFYLFNSTNNIFFELTIFILPEPVEN
jgi:hypothetical protein